MRWRRRSTRVLQFVVALVTVAVALPATAITNGEFDGSDHPNVGSIVVRIPDPVEPILIQWCSGTLIHEDVFLTASHCTDPLDGFVEAVPGAEVLVTFDPTISSSATFFTADVWVTNPNYNGFKGKGGASDPGDIAVILFDDPIPGITPASLPSAGLLDQMKAGGTLNSTRFTAVGYGTVRVDNHGGWQGILDNLDRNRAEQGYRSLTKAWLNLAMTPSNGNGGTCYGDSGGPHFLGNTDVVASLTVTGDAQCKASDKTYRTDSASARGFLDDYVTLP